LARSSGEHEYLVLADPDDAVAQWASDSLRAGGLTPLELVTSEELCDAPSWEHRLTRAGVTVEIGLADGRLLQGAALRGVLNRLNWVPPSRLDRAIPEDRDYVAAELMALLLSALHSLSAPVINRPSPFGLAGQWRWPVEWHALAARAGLPTRPYVRNSDDERDDAELLGDGAAAPRARATQLVIGRAVVGGPAPPELLVGCRQLATLAGTEVLGVDFVSEPTGELFFAGASPIPDLRLGGAPAAEALAAALGAGDEVLRP
jgi:hypothetical protein